MTASLAYAWLGQLGLIAIAAWIILWVIWPAEPRPKRHRASSEAADLDTEG